MITELNWFNLGNYKNNGPVIGYRRVSGKIGLTNKENGTRGAWVEKRVALFRNLINHNYKIICFTEGTEETKKAGYKYSSVYQYCDVLFLEFGGTNLQFYGKAWEQTLNIIKQHKGKIYFINDDPDLPFLWKLLPDENWSRWTIAANATNCKNVAEILKCPPKSKVIDLPMQANIDFADYHSGEINKVVYIGRPNGRTKYFKEYLQSQDLQISGKANEWNTYKNLSLLQVPQQKDRRRFYQNFYGCLAVFDEKHRNCGWRTGRAYHAVYAGIPVIAPPKNDGLAWTYTINSAKDITDFVKLIPAQRKEIWEKQKLSVSSNQFYDFLR